MTSEDIIEKIYKTLDKNLDTATEVAIIIDDALYATEAEGFKSIDQMFNDIDLSALNNKIISIMFLLTFDYLSEQRIDSLIERARQVLVGEQGVPMDQFEKYVLRWKHHGH